MKKSATKKTVQKKPSKAAKASDKVTINGPGYKENRSVRIERADNGLTVRTWDSSGEKLMVAKSDAEALRHAKALLGK